MSTRLIIWGASGRMGQAISRIAAESETVVVVAGVTRGDEPKEVKADVVVDFSLPSAARDALDWARRHRVAFVSGTTGLGAKFDSELSRAATEIPVLHATNMSLGVAVLRALTRLAADALPEEFQPEISEVHHRHKRDSPSGTAKSLIRDLQNARPALMPRTGRAGDVGARGANELGVHSVRGGDVVGEHTVHFYGNGERVELTHCATDRAIFARGALAAALWVHGRGPGLYTMDDVLGLTSKS